jgi:DNA polymerase IV
MRNLNDISKRDDLTFAQEIGLKYVDELQERIPRDEVSKIAEIIQRDLNEFDLIAEPLGSYRRGALDCGDIDMLIYSHGELKPGLIKVIIEKLKKSVITDVIAHSGKTFRGICKVDQFHRRLDLLLCPKEELGAARLYFTGNDIFNRSIRLLADKKGMHLNQHGLYRQNVRICGATEQEIFDVLGVPYRPPEERNT